MENRTSSGEMATVAVNGRPYPRVMAVEVSASEFKAKCLRMLDAVAVGREEFIVTRRGRPVARLVPVAPAAGLAGSVEILVDGGELVVSTGEPWTAER